MNKYAGDKCCVCSRYGAHEPFGEPIQALKLFARNNRLTIRTPDSNAVHEKCLRKLKALANWKNTRMTLAGKVLP